MRTLGILLIFVAVVVAVPAPKAPPVEPTAFSIVGTWEMRWGTIRQFPSFAADGTHDDPQFGPGPWEAESLGDGMFLIRFVERGNEYAVKFELETGNGWGCRLAKKDGRWVYDWAVNVKLSRVERMPIGPIE